MYINLTGKTALITGSTNGIGLAIATGLAQAGADIVITGRHKASVDSAVAQIKDALTQTTYVKGIVAVIQKAFLFFFRHFFYE